MPGRGRLAAVIVAQGLGAGLLSLVALRWIGFLGLPPVFFLTLLLAGMPVGALILIRVEWLRQRTLQAILVLSAGLALGSAAALLGISRWTHALSDAFSPKRSRSVG